MTLAGGAVNNDAVFTGGGEVMMKGPQDGRGWILPLCRIIRELGALVVWDVTDFELPFPCGRVVTPIEESGLRYIRAEDLFLD